MSSVKAPVNFVSPHVVERSMDPITGAWALTLDPTLTEFHLEQLSRTLRQWAIQLEGAAVPYVLSEMTISSGEIDLPIHSTPSVWVGFVDTESDAASDDLDTINNGVEGDLLVLQTAADARDVNLTVAGNLKIGFASPFILSATTDVAEFIYTGTTWNARSLRNNG